MGGGHQAGPVAGRREQVIKKRSIEQGLFAANIPTEFGGGGLDTLTFTLLEREFGWVSYALQYAVHRPCNAR